MKDNSIPGSSPRVRGRPLPCRRATPGSGAHPRGCGADKLGEAIDDFGLGSSPRVRGRQRPVINGSTRGGLIPAGAGQTSPRPVRLLRRWAHPRGCGADKPGLGTGARMAGSSPRVRGRPLASLISSGAIRLIPAGAGQTSVRIPPLNRGGAHPRGCGADRITVTATGCDGGSSPRVRGRPVAGGVRAEDAGLIPAGAGQTRPSQAASWCPTAHPRGCGADTRDYQLVPLHDGSSPRVRGRPKFVTGQLTREGLIPAGAGQTTQESDSHPSQSAHPRGCGADFRTGFFQPECRGLIPAGAGQTASDTSPSAAMRAHPRGCGADSWRVRTRPRRNGSSPRVRGRPTWGVCRFVASGLIPAGAGQTPIFSAT